LGQRAVQTAWRLGTGEILTLASNFAVEPVAFTPPAAQCLFGEAPPGDALPGMTTLAFLAPAP
jgi:hypothetical protein